MLRDRPARGLVDASEDAKLLVSGSAGTGGAAGDGVRLRRPLGRARSLPGRDRSSGAEAGTVKGSAEVAHVANVGRRRTRGRTSAAPPAGGAGMRACRAGEASAPGRRRRE